MPSLLQFDPAVGLIAPTTAEVREDVAAQFRAAFSSQGDGVVLDTDPSTPAGQLVDAITAEITARNDLLVFLSNQQNPRTASGKWQDALGKIYFLERKTAEATVVVCRCSGLRGTVIPYGALVGTADGYTLMSTTASGLRIGDEGYVDGPFRLTETGPIAIAAGTVTKIRTVVPGWDSVTNNAAGSMGRDEESRAEFEARRFASVAINSHGSAASIYAGIAALDGVLDCKVLENRGNTAATQFGVSVPPHGVAICVYGGDDGAIAKAIYERIGAGSGVGGNTTVSYVAKDHASATYEYLIVRPTAVAFKVKVTLTSAPSEQVRNAIKRAVLADFNGSSEVTGNVGVGLAQTVYSSRFYGAVLPEVGASGLLTVTVALGTGSYGTSVTIRADQEPTLSLDDITVTTGS